jgi:hypothetical protein
MAEVQPVVAIELADTSSAWLTDWLGYRAAKATW